MKLFKVCISCARTIRFDLNIVVVSCWSPHHEINTMIVNLGGKDVTSEKHEFHLGEIFGVLPELEFIEAAPCITLRRHAESITLC